MYQDKIMKFLNLGKMHKIVQQKLNTKGENYILERLIKYKKSFKFFFFSKSRNIYEEDSHVCDNNCNNETSTASAIDVNDYVEIQGLKPSSNYEIYETSTDETINNRQSELIVTENDLYGQLKFGRS